MTGDDFGVEPEVFYPAAEVGRIVRDAMAIGVVAGFIFGLLCAWTIYAVEKWRAVDAAPRVEIAASADGGAYD